MSSSSVIKEKTNWKKVAFITGAVFMIAGAFDPLEGSAIIAAGSILVTISTNLSNDKHHHLFLTSMIMILFGVYFMFYFSLLGGFGGRSSLSKWWGLFIVPYPAGWLLSIVLLIIHVIKKKKLPYN
ncbi:MAG: hypothetical protein ABL872_07440 [Lacibacter sp.]